MREIIRGERLSKPLACPTTIFDEVMKKCWDENHRARPSFDKIEAFLTEYQFPVSEYDSGLILDIVTKDDYGSPDYSISTKKLILIEEM